MQGMIMVNQQEDGGMGPVRSHVRSDELHGFGSTTGANPENEQMKMMSHTMLLKIVKALDLNTSYWQDNGFWKRRVNYYKDEPVKITIPEQIVDTLGTSTLFRMEGPSKGPWRLTVKQRKTMCSTPR